MIISRVISGGQTGADRGALEAAIIVGVPHGGYCPSGRKSEDGQVPAQFLLQETGGSDYRVRTKLNVEASDATMVLSRDGKFDRGTGLTLRLIQELSKPYVRLNLRDDPGPQVIATVSWLRTLASKLGRPIIINVAGPRESRLPGLQYQVRTFMVQCLLSLREE